MTAWRRCAPAAVACLAACAAIVTGCADGGSPTSSAERVAPAPTTSALIDAAAGPYDTSWRTATVAGVPCRVGPGPVGHTELIVQPFTPPVTTTVCTQLIPGGRGATYQ